MFYKVKEVAKMVGVTVRALHHYDQIGILKPESLSEAGYRLYTSKELERLQQITGNFYNCTPEIFRGFGDLYVCDKRFTKNIDKYKEGLAGFLREAMHYYCDNVK